MIQLIASDVDGTLLQGHCSEIDPEIFTLIHALRQKNIVFCAASGRQYASLRKLFSPVADDIVYACDNGAVVYHHDNILSKTSIPQEHCVQLVAQILAQPNCEVLISGANTCYLMSKNEAFFYRMRDEVGNNTVRIESLDDIHEDIIKISIFCDKPAADYEPLFAPVWSRYVTVALAGKYWLDFTLANKGTALSQIGATFSIPAQNMMVFGDNFNDVPMFQFAGTSFAMENAAYAVKAAAQHTCATVASVLRTLL